MARVLVTGGTGTLGRPLVERLAAKGHEVTALSRRQPTAPCSQARYVLGDVLTGEGVDTALEGVDAVVHAATSPRQALRTEVAGTARTLVAARRRGAHFLYVSIVGVDRNPFSYYRAKLDAERVVEAAEGWTIQRATQFHELVDRLLGLPAFPVTRHLAFQPVDVRDVSDRLVDLVERGPGGRVEDFGGPEVLGARQLASLRRQVTGHRTVLVPVPPVGFLGAFDRGENLCPDHRSGTTTWVRWLEERAGLSRGRRRA